MASLPKIDVHHHVYPPVYTEALNSAGGDPSGWFIPPWTHETDKKLSARINNTTAILSNTAPGASILSDPAAAAKLAREMNLYSAQLRDDDPQGYSFFASLPSLLETDACLAEIAYAYDVLHADGITLFTRYGSDNHYLGHPDFHPIWRVLEQRNAVVFVHPTHPVDTNLVNPHLPQPMFDYPHETGRAAIDMLLNNVLVTYPSVKIILSHAGGTLPYLIDRVAVMLPETLMRVPGKTREDIFEEASRFYFDTALSAGVGPLKALMTLLRGQGKKGHVMFGSDFPNAPEEGILYFSQGLEGMVGEGVMSQEELESVCTGAAGGLFPRLKVDLKGEGEGEGEGEV